MRKYFLLYSLSNLHCIFHEANKALNMMLRSLTLCTLLAASSAFLAPQSAQRTFLAKPASQTALNVAIDTSDIKNGLTIELNGEPYKVLNFSIMKQARGAAKTTIKFKNLIKGTTIENTYRSGEKFETAQIEKSEAQYTYKDEVRIIKTCIQF